MENKIYKVIKSDLYIDGGIQSTETKIFMDKQLALTYLRLQIRYIHQNLVINLTFSCAISFLIIIRNF